MSIDFIFILTYPNTTYIKNTTYMFFILKWIKWWCIDAMVNPSSVPKEKAKREKVDRRKYMTAYLAEQNPALFRTETRETSKPAREGARARGSHTPHKTHLAPTDDWVPPSPGPICQWGRGKHVTREKRLRTCDQGASWTWAPNNKPVPPRRENQTHRGATYPCHWQGGPEPRSGPRVGGEGVGVRGMRGWLGPTAGTDACRLAWGPPGTEPRTLVLLVLILFYVRLGLARLVGMS